MYVDNFFGGVVIGEKKVLFGWLVVLKLNYVGKEVMLKKNEVIVLFIFEVVELGDLGFKKGDVIIVLKKMDNVMDWW